MIEILKNKQFFFENNIDCLIITEKIFNNKAISIVFSMYDNTQKKMLNIPYLEQMSKEYLIEIFQTFSKEYKQDLDINKIEKELKLNNQDAKNNFFKIIFVTQSTQCEFFLDVYSYQNILNDHSMSIDSLQSIDHIKIPDFNIDEKNIKKIDIKNIPQKLNMTEFAYIQFIQLLSIFLSKSINNQILIDFISKKNLSIKVNEFDFIDVFYLNGKLLFKQLLYKDMNLNLEKKIIINSEWDGIQPPLENHNKIIFLDFNNNSISLHQLIDKVYFIIDNEKYVCHNTMNIFDLLERIIG